jgi:hypothetical protein
MDNSLFVILNPHGQLWTAKMFKSEAEARQCVEKTLRWIKPENIRHTIVPASEVEDLPGQLDYLLGC